MRGRRRRASTQSIVCAAAAIAVGGLILNGARLRAQNAAPALQLTSQRVQAFIDASARRLRYVPGEVLVKFKSGTSSAQQQRALMGVRSRPAVSDLRWSG